MWSFLKCCHAKSWSCCWSQDGHTINVASFPMKCVKVKTLMQMDRMKTFGEMDRLGLLVTPGPSSKVHFVSHEWLSYGHPDPSGTQLRRLQDVFRKVMAGRGHELFSEADWKTFSQGTASSWTPQLAHLEGSAQSEKLSDDSFRADVEQGLAWIDFSSIPQLADADPSTVSEVAANQKAAVESIPFYLQRSNFFWVLTPTATHEDRKETCGFVSWRGRGWCRLEEWANFLSVPSMMPLVVFRRGADLNLQHGFLHDGQHRKT